MRRLLLPLLLAPVPAAAHDTFGGLGPFYAGLFHPLADPAQGLVLAALAVLLARQPLATVRSAWIVLVAAGALAIALPVGLGAPSLRASAVAAAALGLAAIPGVRLGRLPASLLAAAVGAAAGLAVDLPAGRRDAVLAGLGGALGIALLVLLLWGLADALVRRLGPVAGAVAGSWVAAIGLMAAVLPR